MKVTNTSTLISLSRINRLNLLKELRLMPISPEEICKEATEKEEYVDAISISKYFNEGIIKKKHPSKNSKDTIERKLGRKLKGGDHDVVSLAYELKATHILTDDEGLQKIARSFGWKSLSSPDILFLALKGGVLGINGYKTDVRKLVMENRISSELAELYIIEGEKYAESRE